MFANFLAAVLFVLAVFAAGTPSCKPEGRGWGDHIHWSSLEDAVEAAGKQDKPIMLIIHKTWCGACKRLAPQFAESKSIAQLSSSFLMVNCEDDEEPEGSVFKPDGSYFPRILFLNSNGMVDSTLFNNKGPANYKYYYSSPDMIREGMQRALGKHRHGSDEL